MNQRLRRSPSDVVYTPIDVTSTLVAEYVRSLSSALEPGQDTTLSWTHLPQGPGDFFLQFAVAKDSSFSGTSLMDSAPGTPELLIKVQSF